MSLGIKFNEKDRFGLTYPATSAITHLSRNGRHVSAFTRALAAATSFQQKDGVRRYTATYDQIQRDFHVSRPTISAAIKMLDELEIARKEFRDATGTTYKYVGQAPNKHATPIPHCLYGADITYLEKNTGEHKTRKLTKTEVRILAEMIAKGKKKDRTCESTIAELARFSGCSKRSVFKALDVFFAARIVSLPEEDKNAGKYRRHLFHLDSALYKFQEAKNKYLESKTKRAAKQLSPEQKRVEASNAMSDRAHHYAVLREKAQQRAEKYIRIAERDPRYQKANEEMRKITGKSLAEAMEARIHNPELYQALLAKKKRLQNERCAALRALHIKEEWLHPQYECEKCSDTGFLPNGKACDCYRC